MPLEREHNNQFAAYAKALQMAMQHAPNTWIDSPKMMHQKLTTILQNLNDVEKDAVQYGTKGQTVKDVPADAGGAKLKDRVTGKVLVEGKDF